MEKKILPKKISPQKVYHIYAKDQCLYQNLTEKQFNKTWINLNGMVGIMKTDYVIEDLSYKEIIVSDWQCIYKLL